MVDPHVVDLAVEVIQIAGKLSAADVYIRGRTLNWPYGTRVGRFKDSIDIDFQNRGAVSNEIVGGRNMSPNTRGDIGRARYEREGGVILKDEEGDFF